MKQICEAVLGCEDLIVKSGLKIYFMCFDDYCCVSSIEHLKPLMERTGGRIIEWKEDI
jgi:hypothetical protein